MTGRVRRAAILALGLAVAATQLNAPAVAGPQFLSPLLPVPIESDWGWPPEVRIKPVSAPVAADQELLERADGLIDAGRLGEALELTKRELSRNESQRGANDPTVASWLIRL